MRRRLLHFVQHRAVHRRNSVHDNRGKHLLQPLQREILVVPAVPVRWSEKVEKEKRLAAVIAGGGGMMRSPDFPLMVTCSSLSLSLSLLWMMAFRTESGVI